MIPLQNTIKPVAASWGRGGGGSHGRESLSGWMELVIIDVKQYSSRRVGQRWFHTGVSQADGDVHLCLEQLQAR